MTYKSGVNFVDEALRCQLQQMPCVVRTCTPDETTVLTRQLHSSASYSTITSNESL